MGVQLRSDGRRLARPARRPTTRPADDHPLLDLQTRVGNQAVTQFVQRKVTFAAGRASDVEFRVGTEISKALAQQAKAAARGGISTAELATLRATTLSGGTITDDEQMFLAGLLDPGNATLVASMATTAGGSVSFSVATIRPHLKTIADTGRPALDATVESELRLAKTHYFTSFNQHMLAARTAAIGQIHQLFPGPPWRAKADKLIAESTMWTGNLLKAMLAAASDSTPGDQILAGIVYLVASRAGHPLADDLLFGRLKVDQLSGSAPRGQFATYSAFGTGDSKGDTIYVYSDLDLNNLAHRRAVIHELEHAVDDKSTAAGHWRPTAVDDAEVRAYRAGSRYALEKLAQLDDDVTSARNAGVPAQTRAAQRAYATAVQQLAAEHHPIHIIGLALEAHRNLGRFEWRVIDVNAAIPATKRAPTTRLAQLLSGTDAVVEQDLRNAIRAEYQLLTPTGGLDPAKNLGRMDAFSGQSILDTVDLPKI